jgi:hypothetical protein
MFLRLHGPNRSTRQNARRRRFECLERRDMLSGTPPTVLNVEVGSTSWSSAFVQYLKDTDLGTNGYAIPTGSTAQSASLTWTNINQIHIVFSEDVDVDAADLSLSGINTTAYAFSDFHYDPIRHVASWTLASALNKDRLRIDLDADGIDPVRDLNSNLLDGDWTNNVSIVSGSGDPGTDFQFNFNVLPTDVDNSGGVSIVDYLSIGLLNGKSTTTAGYLAARDIDGSGTINSLDSSEAWNRMFQTLPGGSPAGTNNDAPTTRGVARVPITNAAIDVAVSLTSDFGDLESGGNGLTYSIRSNSNPGLFDSATINPSTKQLVLNAASSVSGRATIVVRATDPSGLFVETPVTVDVNRQNVAPEIQNFFIHDTGGFSYIVSGDIVDSDDDVSNFIVSFSNVFEIRSAVNENGHFEFVIVLDEDDWGTEEAVTLDPHGALSPIEIAWVG